MLGATGMIGSRIAALLEAAGCDVVRASRASGVDARTGRGLAAAVEGADAVVDALNLTTLSARQAVDFFAGSAQNVVEAMRAAEVSRLVCVSIAGAADPAVNRFFGYYRGKAAQEEAYRHAAAGRQVVILRSAQWYELIDDLVARASLGPFSLLPAMRIAPLAVDSAAARAVREAMGAEDPASPGTRLTAPPGVRLLAIRGPEVTTVREAALRIQAARGVLAGRRRAVMVECPYFGAAMARGGLVPSDAIVDPVTLDEWLAQQR